MPNITEPITFVGFAWLDEDGAINWAMREDLEHLHPNQRPEGCTPCVVEITPSEEWALRKQQDHDFLGDISSKINQFSSELEALQHSLKVGRT